MTPDPAALDVRDSLDGRLLPEAELIAILKNHRALWQHSGRPEDPHAILSSGLCGDGFIDVLQAIRRSRICALFGEQMKIAVLKRLRSSGFDGSIDWVVGSDHGSAAFSHSVALSFAAQHDFTEKAADKKKQIWERLEIKPGETVLQAEEVIIQGRATMAVREAVRKGNRSPVTFAPVIATLLHQSHLRHLDGVPIVWLVHVDINVWDPSECPLCAAGSPRVNPRTNWTELAGPGPWM
jgi:orotate phosphoribosyltransferase